MPIELEATLAGGALVQDPSFGNFSVVPVFSRVVKTHISLALCLPEGDSPGDKSLKRNGSHLLKKHLSVGCG